MLEQDETEALPEATPGADVSPDQSQAPIEAAAPQQAPVEQFGGANFNPQHFKMDYRGQTSYPRDAAHAKALMQQGLSYSQSMEKLGADTKAFESRQQELESTYGKYKEFDEQLKNNPDQYTKFQQYWNGNGDTEQPNQSGQTFNRVYDEKVAGLEGKIQSLLDANEDRTLQSNMEKIREQNPTLDWNSDQGDGKLDVRIMRHAHQLGLNENQLELAFLDYHKDTFRQNASVNGAAQVANKVQAQNKAGIVQGAQASAPQAQTKSIDHKNLTHSQLSGMAKKDMGLV